MIHGYPVIASGWLAYPPKQTGVGGKGVQIALQVLEPCAGGWNVHTPAAFPPVIALQERLQADHRGHVLAVANVDAQIVALLPVVTGLIQQGHCSSLLRFQVSSIV